VGRVREEKRRRKKIREEIREEKRVRREKIKVREKVETSRYTLFFSNVLWHRRVEKKHAKAAGSDPRWLVIQ
jgi:hypothetical protein